MQRATRIIGASLALFTPFNSLLCQEQSSDDGFEFSTLKTIAKDKRKVYLPIHVDTRTNWQYDIYGYTKSKMSDFNRKKIYSVAKSRRFHVESMDNHSSNANQYDIIIVGGGFIGSALLLECALQGLHCALLEKGDFGSNKLNKEMLLLPGSAIDCLNIIKGSESLINKVKTIWHNKEELKLISKSLPFAIETTKVVIPIKGRLALCYYYILSQFLNIRSNSKIQVTSRNKCSILPGEYRYGLEIDNESIPYSRLILSKVMTSTIESYMGGFIPGNVANYSEVIEYIYDKSGHAIGVKAHDRISNIDRNIYSKAVICTLNQDKSNTLLVNRNIHSIPNILELKGSNEHYGIKANGIITVSGNATCSAQISKILFELEKQAIFTNIHLLSKKSAISSIQLYGTYTSNTKLKSNPFPVYSQFLKSQYKLPEKVCNHLVSQYGTKCIHVAELGSKLSQLKQISPQLELIQSEVAFTVRHEMATNLNDVIYRRFAVGYLKNEPYFDKLVKEIAALMSKELKWSKSEMANQIKSVLNS